ncbi:hypothetical protein VAE151_520213 [Vibrio aestuarianus]|uniref:Uncharacterized protein n=1 Tax=Vibrio aestuarianus TaxID=28171 RepID=A0ABM9FMX5_9VIBR|nr:hypothetical protein VAE308_1010215 [Vibrio aestuarianus]CAH8186238.1 Protein of unknown function [Vibrio aestuarianus subsp. francensis]CAH8186095.1 hypothetical protein VAE032_240214 [Vibrio aestuarianus]CAH8186197.1 hypothetical protein VAE055_340216 [Vibrio aestuarianus]CAH8186297.1 hypothetical protein VAE128_440217 [Vibrio aestuarianus]
MELTICAMLQTYDYSLAFDIQYFRNKTRYQGIGRGIEFRKNARLPHLMDLSHRM